jgi:hypothetical protein
MRIAYSIRWALIPVAIGAAWLASIGIGVAIFGALERMCPESQMVSGMCIAPWWPYAEEAFFSLSAAIAAANVVLAASLTAPSGTRRVAWITYSVGLLVAWVFAEVISDPYPLAAAAVAGALAVWWIRRRSSGLFSAGSGHHS